jgi:hypothetical protein
LLAPGRRARMIDATDLTALDWLPPVVLAIALTAWTLAFAGLVTTTARSRRGHSPNRTGPPGTGQ